MSADTTPTRDEVLTMLRTTRTELDRLVAGIDPEDFETPVPGGTHSPKQIVAHVSAYEQLIVERLRASREGRTTEFDRDRVGWESFNERVWAEAARDDALAVLERSQTFFAALLFEVGLLSDGELASATGSTAALDPAWLDGRAPWELIAIDAYDHYPMHVDALRGAQNR